MQGSGQDPVLHIVRLPETPKKPAVATLGRWAALALGCPLLLLIQYAAIDQECRRAQQQQLDNSALARLQGRVPPDPDRRPPRPRAQQEQLVGERLVDASWLASRLVDSLVRR